MFGHHWKIPFQFAAFGLIINKSFSKLAVPFSPLLHGRWRVIQPGEIADHGFVVTVIALADLHGSDLCQTHLQVPPKRVLVERLAAGLHMALENREETRSSVLEQNPLSTARAAPPTLSLVSVCMSAMKSRSSLMYCLMHSMAAVVHC